MYKTILSTKKPLSFRETLGLLVNINVSYDEWGNLPFMALVRAPTKQKELLQIPKLCQYLSKRSVEILRHNIIRNDRKDRKAQVLKKPKKGSWGTLQRHGLFVDKLQYRLDNLTIQEYYYLALEFFEQQGWQPPTGTRGPNQQYNRQKLAAAVLVGFVLQKTWRELRRELLSSTIDLRTTCGRKNNVPKVPSIPIFHRLFQQIPPTVLEALWEEIGAQTVQRWQQLTQLSPPLEFVVDSSFQPTPFEEAFMYADTLTYRKISLKFALLMRNIPHVVEGLFIPDKYCKSTRDIRQLITKVPKGGIILADSEYDVEYLQEAAYESNVQLMANPKQVATHPALKPHRRRAHAEFDPYLYRRRKLGERIYGILRKRGIQTPKRCTYQTIWQTLRWGIVAHNYRVFLKTKIKDTIFQLINLTTRLQDSYTHSEDRTMPFS